MPGPELPPDMIRLLADLRKRLAALEKRRPREVGNLDDLDDTEVLYLSPSSKPAEGDALVWDPDPSVPKFGGLWKPGWTAMPMYTWSSGGYVDAAGGIDIYGDVDPTSGWYAVSVWVQGDTLPADSCGWEATASVSADGLAITAPGWSTSGLHQGVWTGSTGDSGTYGWQAPELASTTPDASAFAALSVSSSLTVAGSATAYVLTDPGVDDTDFGSPTCTAVPLDVTLSFLMIRIAPL